MSKLGAFLQNYLTETGKDQIDFVRDGGPDAGALSRIIKGETEVASDLNFGRIVAALRGKPELQAKAVACQIADYLGEELGKFVEVRPRIRGRSQEFQMPLDELELGVRDLREFGRTDETVKASVVALANVVRIAKGRG